MWPDPAFTRPTGRAGAPLFPHPFFLGNLGYALSRLGERWDPIWDFRGAAGGMYADVLDAYAEASDVGFPHDEVIVAEPQDVEAVREATARARGVRFRDGTPTSAVIPMRARNLRPSVLDLTPFDEGLASDLVDYTAILDPSEEEAIYGVNAYELGILSEDGFGDSSRALEQELVFAAEYIEMYELAAVEQTKILDAFLRRIASNSLLVELGIHLERDRVSVVPYHSHSLHHVANSNDSLVLVRPARRHAGYIRTFHRDLARLESLLNDINVRRRR